MEPSRFAGGNAKMHWMLVQTRGDSAISPNVYVNTESSYGSSPWMSAYAKESDICIPQKDYTQASITVLFTAEQGRNKQNTYHLVSGLKNVLQPHNGILFGHKKSKVVIDVAVWMNLENIMLNEIS